MGNSEPIGPWSKWAIHLIETIKSLSADIKSLQEQLSLYIQKDECEKDMSEIQQSISSLRSTLGTATTTLTELKGKLESHVEKHEYKWKIIAGISTVIGVVLGILKVIEYLK